jgi:hypothetical protein
MPMMRRSWRFNIFDQEVAGLRFNVGYRVEALGAIHNFTTGYMEQIEDQINITDEVRRPGTTQTLWEFFNPLDANPNLAFFAPYERFRQPTILLPKPPWKVAEQPPVHALGRLSR